MEDFLFQMGIGAIEAVQPAHVLLLVLVAAVTAFYFIFRHLEALTTIMNNQAEMMERFHAEFNYHTEKDEEMMRRQLVLLEKLSVMIEMDIQNRRSG